MLCTVMIARFFWLFSCLTLSHDAWLAPIARSLVFVCINSLTDFLFAYIEISLQIKRTFYSFFLTLNDQPAVISFLPVDCFAP